MSQSDRLLDTIPELGAFELSGVLGLDTAERPSAIERFIIDLASRAPEQDMTASRWENLEEILIRDIKALFSSINDVVRSNNPQQLLTILDDRQIREHATAAMRIFENLPCERREIFVQRAEGRYCINTEIYPKARQILMQKIAQAWAREENGEHAELLFTFLLDKTAQFPDLTVNAIRLEDKLARPHRVEKALLQAAQLKKNTPSHRGNKIDRVIDTLLIQWTRRDRDHLLDLVHISHAVVGRMSTVGFDHLRRLAATIGKLETAARSFRHKSLYTGGDFPIEDLDLSENTVILAHRARRNERGRTSTRHFMDERSVEIQKMLRECADPTGPILVVRLYCEIQPEECHLWYEIRANGAVRLLNPEHSQFTKE